MSAIPLFVAARSRPAIVQAGPQGRDPARWKLHRLAVAGTPARRGSRENAGRRKSRARRPRRSRSARVLCRPGAFPAPGCGPPGLPAIGIAGGSNGAAIGFRPARRDGAQFRHRGRGIAHAGAAPPSPQRRRPRISHRARPDGRFRVCHLSAGIRGARCHVRRGHGDQHQRSARAVRTRLDAVGGPAATCAAARCHALPKTLQAAALRRRVLCAAIPRALDDECGRGRRCSQAAGRA